MKTGSKKGILTVIGIGPGALDQMTMEAYYAIEESAVVAGYKVYVDLLFDRFPRLSEKKIITTAMRQEEKRCALALEEAAQGQRVAFICSGDAGVYGLAGLIYEMAQDYPSVEVRVVPGVTAALSGAARLGAPLVHDFALISLSDLMTPWETIEKRLRMAAEGDFAIVLYNVSSKKRADYLEKACDILLETRSPEQVCGAVRNIGRSGEKTRVCTLGELRDMKADMFTTVFIGNRSTKRIGDKIVTPRGYARERRADERRENELREKECRENVSRPVLIFGGTTEGRIAAEQLLAEGVPCTVSVATHYGEEVMKPHPLMSVRTGRLDSSAMAQLIREGKFACVIDATHPHAQIVSGEISAACAQTDVPYLRLQRKDSVDAPEKCGTAQVSESEEPAAGKCVYVNDIEEAGAFLASVQGQVFVTTGSKELGRLVKEIGDPSRITARVLPSIESLRACEEAGLAGRQILAMQGPFDTEMNCAMIRRAGASWIVTKESGTVGGFPEKIEAAQKCGIGAVVIRMPAKGSGELPGSGSEGSAEGSVTTGTAQGLDLAQAVSCALSYARTAVNEEGPADSRMETPEGSEGERLLSLVGIGVGAPEAVTEGAKEAIAEAEVLFGAKSVLENARKAGIFGGASAVSKEKTALPFYKSDAVLDYLKEHQEVRKAAVLYSGDSGFYSGAASMMEEIRSGKAAERGVSGLKVRVVCGISCASWFAARAGIAWQDWRILSSHGRFCNVVGQVRRNRECFLLPGSVRDLAQTGQLLAKAQEKGVLGELELILGYELSRPAEKILPCTAQELAGLTEEGLYVLYIRHESAVKTPILPGLPDSAFIRGKAPMTASEIRALSLSRLGLTAQAVVWDIGAGTGSVSVEAAMTCPEGKVWSVEYKKEALELLAQNREKFCLQNMEIIEGRAPEALEQLPAPTHVFVGGSGGEIGSILTAALEKNPEARIVVNCITAETLSALWSALKELPVQDVQCVQVSVNREERLGNYHFLRGENPVFVLSFSGAGSIGLD